MSLLAFIIFEETIRVIITSRFATSFFEKDSSKLRRLCAYVISVVLTSAAYYLFNLNWLNLTSTLAGLIIIAFSYHSEMKRKVQFVLYILAISCIVDLLFYALMNNTFDYENYSEPANILSLFVLLIIQLITKKVMSNDKDGELDDTNWWQYISTLVICIVTSLIVIMDDTISLMSLTVVCIALMVINLINIFIMDDLIDKKRKDYENMILKEQSKAYERELLLQEENHENMKAFRHDIKHHMTQISAMNDTGNKEELRQYIDEVMEALYEVTPICYTGNSSIDGMLNYMLQKAKDKGIEVNSRITIPEDIKVSAYDMNIILGNLIDNAIEANECVIESHIDLVMKYVNETLVLEISNTYGNEIIRNNGRFISTKQDRDAHGYGIRNIYKVLEKYEHTIFFDTADNIFTVKILIKI